MMMMWMQQQQQQQQQQQAAAAMAAQQQQQQAAAAMAAQQQQQAAAAMAARQQQMAAAEAASTGWNAMMPDYQQWLFNNIGPLPGRLAAATGNADAQKTRLDSISAQVAQDRGLECQCLDWPRHKSECAGRAVAVNARKRQQPEQQQQQQQQQQQLHASTGAAGGNNLAHRGGWDIEAIHARYIELHHPELLDPANTAAAANPTTTTTDTSTMKMAAPPPLPDLPPMPSHFPLQRTRKPSRWWQIHT